MQMQELKQLKASVDNLNGLIRNACNDFHWEDLATNGLTMEAIIQYRNTKDSTLKEAKDTVEEYVRDRYGM